MSGTPVDPDLPPEYVDEINVSLEHELRQDTSLRLSYVRKDLSGDSGLWNGPQQAALLAGRGIACTDDPYWDCPFNALTGAPIRVPARARRRRRRGGQPHCRIPPARTRPTTRCRWLWTAASPAGCCCSQLRLPVAGRVPRRGRRDPEPAVRRPAGRRLRRARADLAEPQLRRPGPTGDHQLGGPVAGARRPALGRRSLGQRPAPERLALRADPARRHSRHPAPISRYS